MDVLAAAYRSAGKGRVGRQVLVVRQDVLAGRTFDSTAVLNSAFARPDPSHPQAMEQRPGRDGPGRPRADSGLPLCGGGAVRATGSGATA